MPVDQLSTGKSSTYVHIQDKLAQPFSINGLCREWIIEFLAKNGYDKKALSMTACGSKVVSLKCFNGHQKLVRTSCHMEICPRCGKPGSLTHRRRYARALDRLLWAPVLGYMVFTLPKEVSESMPAKEQLSILEKTAVKIVKDNFNAPGAMARLHLMGEEPEHLHIHVNVLFPVIDTNGKGEVPRETLDNIRQHWTTFVNQTFGLSCKTTNVFYKFATSEIKKRHKIKYVTRPVVIPEKFLSLSNEAKHWYLSLAGWHNTRWYGQLANAKYKEFLRAQNIDLTAHRENDIALARKCPVCGEHYKYQEIFSVNEIPQNQFRRLDADVWVDPETYAVLQNKASP